MNVHNPSRRNVLALLGAGVTLCSVSLRSARAADKTLVKESDADAIALQYVDDAARAKQATPGSNCANCTLYVAEDDPALGACSALQNKLVKAKGWCNAWTNDI